MRGYVTNNQINALLSSEEVKSEQIEDILAKFSEMGVHVVETDPELEVEAGTREEPEEESEVENELIEVQQRPVSSEAKDPAQRTDDPVRMYLRDMSSVALLSRAGEVAIAKRIEAGRGEILAGLCESPLTFQAITIWRDELNEGRVYLRDIVDLDATHARPDAEAMPAPVIESNGQLIVAVPGKNGRLPQMPAPAIAFATPFAPANESAVGEEMAGDGTTGENDLHYEDDGENWLSVAAIEAEHQPKVIKTFDNITGTY
jgi:RNA polymerase primary sigma factor